MKRQNPLKLVALGIAAILTNFAWAQTPDIWTSTSSSLWGTAGNWSTGIPTNTSIATFNNSSGLQTSFNLIPASMAYSLVFSSTGGANSYTFDTAGNQNTNTLTLASGITNSDTAALTFYNATTLGGSQTWTNNGGSMIFYGNVNLGSGALGNTLTVAGNGAVNVGSVIGNGGSAAGNLVYSGTGTLSLTGANTYTGSTTVNSGTLNIQNAGALGTASNTANTTIANGAVLQIQGNITTTNAGTLVLNGIGAGQGALQNISADNTWNSAVSLGSNATIANATAGNVLYIGNAGGASLFTLGSNTLTVDGAGDTFINSSLGVAGDTGGLTKNGTGTLTLWGYNSFYTGATVVNAGSLELVVGPMTSGWYGVNGSLTVGTGSLTNSAVVDIWDAGHPLGASYVNQISPTSAITMNAGGTFNDGVSTTAGSFTMNGGTVNIASGQTITLSNGVTSNTNTAHQTSQILGGTLGLVSPTTTFSVAQDGSLASDLTISSAITGANITKTGNGTLTLSGANTYTGTTTLSAGTIMANSNTALGTGAVAISSGTLGSTNASSITNAITLQGNATLSGITTGGTLTQSGGNYNLIMANATQTGAVNLSANNTGFTLTTQVDSGTSTISGVIANGGTGAGGLTKTGNGTLVLGGLDTYTGATTVNAGTVQLGASNAIGSSSAVSLNNSTLNLNGFSDKIGNLSFNNGTINFGSGSPANTLVFGNITSGAGLLTINGWTSGSTTLAATTAGIAAGLLNEVYFTGSGSGAIEAGSLTNTGNGEGMGYILTPNVAFLAWSGAGADNNWSTGGNWVGGTAPVLTVGSVQKLDFTGGTRLAPVMNNSYYINALKFDSSAGAFAIAQSGNTLTLNGPLPSIIQQSASNQSISGGTIAVSANSVVDVSGAGSLTISSALSGTGSLTKLSGGTLALSGNDSAYSGAIGVDAGTLQVSGSNNVLGTGSTTVLSGATLQVNSGLTLGNALSLTGTGAGGNGALNATPGAGNTATLSGAITLGGATTINLGSGTLAVNGGITGAGNNLTLTGAGNSTIGSAITTGTGAVTLNGTGTTTFSGANTYTGMTTVNSGILNLSGTAVKGSLTVGGGTVNDNASNQFASSSGLTVNTGTFNLGAHTETISNLSGTGGTLALSTGTLTLGGTGSTAFAGSITGSGTLANTNTGSLTLTGASAGFTGTVNLSNGVIVGGATNATGTSTVNVSGTGNFEVQGGSTLASNFNLSTNGAATNNGAIENLSGTNTLTGTVSTTANSRIQSDAGTLTASGPVSLANGTTLNVGGSGNTTINGAITGSVTTALTKDGSGTLALGAANSAFRGAVTVTVGTLQANVGSALSNASSITVNSAGTLLSNAANSLATSGAITVNSGGTLALNGTSDALTGIFNNAGTLAFGSGGSLTLTGSTGTLSGAITGTGTLTLGAGEILTLGANFNDSGLNLVLNGGTLKLNGTNDVFGSLTINSSSIVDFANPAASIFDVSGVSIGSGQTLTVNNWGYAVDYFYSNTDPGAAVNQITFTGSTAPTIHWNTYTDGPDNQHQIVPAPEPSTYGAIFVGISLAGIVVVRRRRQTAA
jgi:fibronectin-binding autotransporter adhesin